MILIVIPCNSLSPPIPPPILYSPPPINFNNIDCPYPFLGNFSCELDILALYKWNATVHPADVDKNILTAIIRLEKADPPK